MFLQKQTARIALKNPLPRFFWVGLFWGAALGVLGSEIAVSPLLFEVDLSAKPKTESLEVFNFSNLDLEFQVSVATWDLDENNKVRILEPNEGSLDQWILINPLRLKIPAGQSAVVRFSVRPRIRPAAGEHRAMIYVTETASHQVGNLQIKGRFGVAVYGYMGPIQREGELHGVEVLTAANPLELAFDITSKGTAHVRMNAQFAIWPASLYPGSERTIFIKGLGNPGVSLPEGVLEVGEVPSTPFLPNTRRTLKVQTRRALEPGDYILDLNGTLGSVTLDSAIPFTVTRAPKPPRTEKPK